MPTINFHPIAIIGIGCRFPGKASSPKAFWEILCKGKDAIVNVPKDRWDIRRFYDPDPDKPGKTYAKQGGFLKEKIEYFDPLFFGISAREAESMDPQQRLLLEVTWEAFEDAGIVVKNLANSNTGVFIGGFCLDSKLLRFNHDNLHLSDNHTSTSSTMTLLSNRISHAFDFKGPSVTMDTACSSSLVTTHYACRSIWNNECNIAVAGGANIMLRPEYPIMMSKGKFLSKHSRCKTFDEDAQGYTRGEGAGIVILKSLDQALDDKDMIHAVIRMSGVNQDGQTQGIFMPNSKSQEQLIREVYKRADLSPNNISYFEAHGTGTQAGDPAEVTAINNVLSENGNLNNKCFIGSVKTNIGHLEAAAGIAGLIKAALVLENKKIPPNLHFNNPNPKIPFDKLNVKVPTTLEDLPMNNRIALASVNSFGYGGTNAHVILETAPDINRNLTKDENTTLGKSIIIPFSARSKKALKDLTEKYSFYVSNNNISLLDIAHTRAFRRDHHNHRFTVAVNSIEELRDNLRAFSIGEIMPGQSTGQSNENPGPVVFVYTGMGPQWWAMGRELLEKNETYKKTINKCDLIFRELSGWSLLEELSANENSSKISQTEVAQPTNFALQIGLTEVLKESGIEPDAVLGHSVGEVAAAYVSGALSLEDALKVSYHRSRLQQTLAGSGLMLAVGISTDDVLPIIDNFDQVSIAAINCPTALTLSGDKDQLHEIEKVVSGKEIFNRFLKVDIAYHSSRMDQIKEEVFKSLKDLTPKISDIPLYSTVTGKLITGLESNAEYWWNNIRNPVKFSDTINQLLERNYLNFLEIGPHPVLKNSIRECLGLQKKNGNLFHTLYRKESDQIKISESIGLFYCNGFSVNWKKIIPVNGQFIRAPMYPWQKERYWTESESSKEYRLGKSGHTFFNTDMHSPLPSWSVELNDQFFPYLKDHVINNRPIFPGAGYIEAGLSLHAMLYENKCCTIKNLEFLSMLELEPKKVQIMSTSYDPSTNMFLIHNKTNEEKAEWKLNAKGTILSESISVAEPKLNLSEIKERCPETKEKSEIYEYLNSRGLNYGPYFRATQSIWKNDNEFLISIKGDSELLHKSDYNLFHPVLMDAAFHNVLYMVGGNNTWIPVGLEQLTFFKSPNTECWCHCTVKSRVGRTLICDLTITDNDGDVLVKINSLSCQSILDNENSNKNLLYDFKWVEAPLTNDINENNQKKKTERCLIFSYKNDFTLSLIDNLKIDGIQSTLAVQGKKFRKADNDIIEINPNSEDALENIINVIPIEEYNVIIYLWPLFEKKSDLDFNCDDIANICLPLLKLVQGLNKLNLQNDITLGIVTQNTEIVLDSDSAVKIINSPIWGLGQVIQNENLNILCKLIDLPSSEITENCSFVINELIATNFDSEVALRNNKRFIKKLNHFANLKNDNAETIRLSTDKPLYLDFVKPGRTETFIFKETENQSPNSDEVEIKIHSTGLNFKDLLKVYGKISSKATNNTYFKDSIGMELTGIITSVGENVTRFKIGDEVIAAAPGTFRTYITIPSNFVFHKPKSLQLNNAFIFITFATAYLGLIKLAQLKKGEKVLIHSATGGLGLAAIQIAKNIGAEIFTTAGSEEKRNYLKTLGIEHIMDSRTLVFVDEIRKITNNYGIDVVINALTGDALKESFDLLAPFGRFIELGKKDIVENNFLPMTTFNRNISFISVDWDRIAADRPDLVVDIMKEVIELFENKKLHALPVQIFTIDNFMDAFRLMAESKHIGKIVITFDKQNVPTLINRFNNQKIKNNCSYLITGGTSGFGIEVAKWLAKYNAGEIILVSRSGSVSEESISSIKRIKENGAKVTIISADISDKSSTEKLFNKVTASCLPLKGIFHGAMVLDDCLISDININRFKNVILPKIQGAILIHQMTNNIELDFLTLFSSISSIVGNKGQCSYVAANYFLDTFSYYRNSLNKPTSTINWGVFNDTGIVSRNKAVANMLNSEGITGFSNKQLIELLQLQLELRKPQLGIFDMDWQVWSSKNPKAAQFSRYSEVSSNNSIPKNLNNAILIKVYNELNNLDFDARQNHMETLIIKQIAQILRFPTDKIDRQKSISSFGVDSLMNLELTNIIKITIGISITSSELLDYKSISEMASQFIKIIMGNKLTNQEFE